MIWRVLLIFFALLSPPFPITQVEGALSGIKERVLATTTPLKRTYTTPPILRAPDRVVTSEFTLGGGGVRSYWVFQGSQRDFGVGTGG